MIAATGGPTPTPESHPSGKRRVLLGGAVLVLVVAAAAAVFVSGLAIWRRDPSQVAPWAIWRMPGQQGGLPQS
ncbi:hypothetical protein BH24ACT5_BH24ACT5_26310 [soil metagenome]